MISIVGVRFRGSGKVYYFDPGKFEIGPGAHVIVETARGMEYGSVVGEIRQIEETGVNQPLRSVIRVAGEEDELRAKRNREREREAMAVCREKIRARGLEMKLIDAEYTFDNNKILFYFTADGRIDFRELVKDLASVFRTRIELRQIGVRDETKILGGIGICGRPLCCSTYLTDFVPVSIKMAKEQNLSLNPTKISGVCGRLMCCLKNEEDTYEYLNSKLPGIGDEVTTPTGAVGTVSSVSVLRQKVKVVIEENDEKEVHEYDVEELSFKPRRRGEHGGKKNRSAREMRERSVRSGDRDGKERSGDRELKEKRDDQSAEEKESGRLTDTAPGENEAKKPGDESSPREEYVRGVSEENGIGQEPGEDQEAARHRRRRHRSRGHKRNAAPAGEQA